MRQVPAKVYYLIVGDGRLARHLQAYFELEALPYSSWSRKQSRSDLATLVQSASHILLAISDNAIETFINENPILREKICVHFSGALVTPLAASAHPLMTFTADETYSRDRYREISFITEKGRCSFNDLLPGLTNPHFEIEPSRKVRYHALCVMSGNFTTLLWEKTFQEFAKLGLPKEVLIPYLEQITQNLATSPVGKSVLTGPLARGDQQTIERHLNELRTDAYADVYRSFVHAFGSRNVIETKAEEKI